MGIEKLTTYMQDKVEGLPAAVWQQLSLCGLPESRLVIDGNSMCLWLYRSNESVQSTAALGGSYPAYYDVVVCFFETLTSDYGVRPIIVFDGVKQDTETTKKRRNDRANTLVKYQAGVYKGFHGLPAPLMTKEVFLDALQDDRIVHCDIHFVDQEADAEIVAIANSLGCPILSSDSDFYIYKITGGFMPLTSLEISPESELLSPTVEVFRVDHFMHQLALKDEDLRLVLPAILGNDNITAALDEFPSLRIRAGDDTQLVSQIIRYACQFVSFSECLASATSTPRFQSNLEQAGVQYQTIPSPSFPPSSTARVADTFLKLQPHHLDRFRVGCFQTFMAEAAVRGECIFRSVFDDVSLKSAFNTSLPIRRAIYQILGCTSPVKEIRRVAEARPVSVSVDFDSQLLIDSAAVPRAAKKKRKSILLSVLQCDQALILDLPSEWQLPIAVTKYWYTQTHSKHFTRAIIASFVACHSTTIPSEAAGPAEALGWGRPTQGTPKLEMVHHYAQWQCVYFDVIALNQVLLEPFQYVSPARLFDGEVAACYMGKSIDGKLRSKGYDVDLYHTLLAAVIPPVDRTKPAPKQGSKAQAPVYVHENPFARLAKMKDRKK